MTTVMQFLDDETIAQMNRVSEKMHNTRYDREITVPAKLYHRHIKFLFSVINKLIVLLGDQMGLGMLWNFGGKENKKQPLDFHIEQALARYKIRHETQLGEANKCHVNPYHTKKLLKKFLTEDEKVYILGMEVILDESIGKWNLWIK